MVGMKLRLTIDLDPEVLAIDVRSFLAAVRYVLRGIFPRAQMIVTFGEPKDPSCKLATRSSTAPTLN